jgi:hypothetical protein
MNHREIYVIFSPGRTGSHIILEAISGIANSPGGLCNATCFWSPNNPTPYNSYSTSENIAIHTHTLQKTINNLHLNPKDITLILSYRKDLFAQAMSGIVARLTNEWNGKDYSDKKVEPIYISKEEFKHKLINLQIPAIPNLTEYKKVVTIFYEDLIIFGPKYIASILDIKYDETQVGKIHRKSPYSYKDCILNWQELYEDFCKDN